MLPLFIPLGPSAQKNLTHDRMGFETKTIIIIVSYLTLAWACIMYPIEQYN